MFCADGTALQVIVAQIVSVMSISIYTTQSPCGTWSDNLVLRTCQWQLFAIFTYCLLIHISTAAASPALTGVMVVIIFASIVAACCLVYVEFAEV